MYEGKQLWKVVLKTKWKCLVRKVGSETKNKLGNKLGSETNWFIGSETNWFGNKHWFGNNHWFGNKWFGNKLGNKLGPETNKSFVSHDPQFKPHTHDLRWFKARLFFFTFVFKNVAWRAVAPWIAGNRSWVWSFFCGSVGSSHCGILITTYHPGKNTPSESGWATKTSDRPKQTPQKHKKPYSVWEKSLGNSHFHPRW